MPVCPFLPLQALPRKRSGSLFLGYVCALKEEGTELKQLQMVEILGNVNSTGEMEQEEDFRFYVRSSVLSYRPPSSQ